MAVNVKLGVDIGNFRSGIKDGQNILKGLNAEMKSAEAEFKATGNAEKLLSDKTKTLNSQLNVQKGIVDQAQAALKAMTDAGVDPADKAYQQLYATMMNAQAGMYQTQAALNSLSAGTEQAAEGANKLTDSVNSIGKKISLDQVISGIDTIKSGLESAAQKAIKLGEDIWNSIMDSAKWADDTKTMAQMYGIDVETFQRMQKLVTNGMDTTVESMLTAQSKLKKGIGSESKAAIEALQELGVAWDESIGAGKYGDVTQARDTMEVFWEAGQKILAMKSDPNAQEDMAQALFGRSWKELVPLFESYKTVEEYNAALEQTQINSAEDVDKLTDLNDKVSELKGNFQTLANDVMAQLAPALTDAADALNGVLTSVLEYLKTEEGQEMLSKLGDAVSGLFGDLSKIDPEQVVSGFVEVFTKVTGGIQWLVDNAETAKGILATVVGAWGLITIGENVLKIVKLVDGISGLTSSGASAGAAAGASWGSAFASAVMTAAPWLIGLYTLLNPAGTAKNDVDVLYNPDGTLTEAGQEAANRRQVVEQAAQEAWDLYRTNQLDQAAIERLRETVMNDNDFQSLLERFMGFRNENGEGWKGIEDIDLTEWLEGIEPPVVEIDPVAPEGAAADLAAQIGTLELPAEVKYVEVTDGTAQPRRRHANGLAYVPYDGYLAELHRGEMVVPAREVSSRNYSSNLYVESMIMNNGTDAEGLAAAMAAAQQRTMSGYGS